MLITHQPPLVLRPGAHHVQGCHATTIFGYCDTASRCCQDLLLASLVPGWTTAIQSSAVLRTRQQQSFRECKIVSLVLYCNAEGHVTSCSASTGIVTLASDFRSNQLQAGDLGIQNTVNIQTDISSSTHPVPVHWLFSATTLLTLTSGPGATDSNCILQHTAASLSAWLYRAYGINYPQPVFRGRLKTHLSSAFRDK